MLCIRYLWNKAWGTTLWTKFLYQTIMWIFIGVWQNLHRTRWSERQELWVGTQLGRWRYCNNVFVVNITIVSLHVYVFIIVIYICEFIIILLYCVQWYIILFYSNGRQTRTCSTECLCRGRKIRKGRKILFDLSNTTVLCITLFEVRDIPIIFTFATVSFYYEQCIIYHLIDTYSGSTRVIDILMSYHHNISQYKSTSQRTKLTAASFFKKQQWLSIKNVNMSNKVSS
jgi:hypothetical protein